eukprot:TRINITY_DN16253_c0_g1_i1.p1 TRINITY_DN16253_c0_g1~~TRINITY_DN16253_c0_g1_i1.p1  ORF type:complete len:376 (+),score=130.69 TRINITY_DN16253_c0_g1_i1:30-1130(+)
MSGEEVLNRSSCVSLTGSLTINNEDSGTDVGDFDDDYVMLVEQNPWKDKVDEQQQAIATLESVVAEHEGTIAKQEKTILALQDYVVQLENVAKAAVGYQETIAELEKVVQGQAAKVNDLSIEVQKTQYEKCSAERARNEAESEACDLRRSRDESSERFQHVMAENRTLNKKFAALEEQVAALREDKRVVSTLDAEMREMQRNLEAALYERRDVEICTRCSTLWDSCRAYVYQEHIIKRVQEDRGNPLHVAAYGDCEQLLDHLLKFHNGREWLNRTDKHNKTALWVGAEKGSVSVVSRLLELGADHSIRESVWLNTPLFAAAYHGHAEVILLLLNNGADRSIASSVGTTPLTICKRNGHHTVAKLLE